MKINVISTLLACMVAGPSTVSAQVVPQFQTTFHFEDSMGNRDSVVVGYDPNAQWEKIEPQYGEIEITSPFDSVFEVRAIHVSDEWLARTVKVLVENGSSTLSSCVNDLNAIFLVHALRPPVTVTYDSTQFPYDACGNLIFTRNWDLHFVPDWTVWCHHCLTYSSKYVDDFARLSPTPEPYCNNFHYNEKEVEGPRPEDAPSIAP